MPNIDIGINAQDRASAVLQQFGGRVSRLQSQLARAQRVMGMFGVHFALAGGAIIYGLRSMVKQFMDTEQANARLYLGFRKLGLSAVDANTYLASLNSILGRTAAESLAQVDEATHIWISSLDEGLGESILAIGAKGKRYFGIELPASLKAMREAWEKDGVEGVKAYDKMLDESIAKLDPHTKKVRDYGLSWSSAWTSITSAIGEGIVIALSTWFSTWEIFVGLVRQSMEILKSIGEDAGEVWSRVIALLNTEITFDVEGLKDKWGMFTTWLGERWEGLKKAWASVSAWISEKGEAAFKGFGLLWDDVQTKLVGAWEVTKLAWQGVCNFFQTAWSSMVGGLKSAFEEATAWLEVKIDWLWSKLSRLWGKVTGTSTGTGSAGSTSILGGDKPALEFQYGGTVPGRKGAPHLAIVHGGERWIAPNQSAGNKTLIIPVQIGGSTLRTLIVDILTDEVRLREVLP